MAPPLAHMCFRLPSQPIKWWGGTIGLSAQQIHSALDIWQPVGIAKKDVRAGKESSQINEEEGRRKKTIQRVFSGKEKYPPVCACVCVYAGAQEAAGELKVNTVRTVSQH